MSHRFSVRSVPCRRIHERRDRSSTLKIRRNASASRSTRSRPPPRPVASCRRQPARPPPVPPARTRAWLRSGDQQPAAPAEQQAGIDAAAARDQRHAHPRRAGLRHQPFLLRLRPAPPARSRLDDLHDQRSARRHRDSTRAIPGTRSAHPVLSGKTARPPPQRPAVDPKNLSVSPLSGYTCTRCRQNAFRSAPDMPFFR